MQKLMDVFTYETFRMVGHDHPAQRHIHGVSIIPGTSKMKITVIDIQLSGFGAWCKP